LNPDERDEEREGPDFDGTSRRLERPKSSGERKKTAEEKKKKLRGDFWSSYEQ
jgi:hypothetical protein